MKKKNLQKVGEKRKSETNSSSSSQGLPLSDGREIKKVETELLLQNPLRHFPPNSFLR
ncbi:hypothetical protein YC2023_009178 [Brassica napus]